MSWQAGLDYLKRYQQSRLDSLNNAKRCKWFTSEVDSTDSLLAYFNGTDENEAWSKLYNASFDPDTVGGGRINKAWKAAAQVDILAGWYRDIRIMYAAGDKARPRTTADFDRYEYLRTLARAYKQDEIKLEFS